MAELKAHCATHPRRDKPNGEEHGDVAWRSGDVAVMSALGISSKPGVLIVPSCALGAWDRPGRLSAEAAWLISPTSPGAKGGFAPAGLFFREVARFPRPARRSSHEAGRLRRISSPDVASGLIFSQQEGVAPQGQRRGGYPQLLPRQANVLAR